MKNIEPKSCAADQERFYFSPFIIKNITVPVRMEPFTHIRVFVSMSTIEHEQTMGIIRKMRGHPIKDHTYVFFVECFNQPHQSLRVTETRSRRKETCALVTSAAVKWVFHNRHELDMRKSHFFDVGYQARSYLVIAVIAFFIMFIRTHPTGKMHFIYAPGSIERIVFLAVLHPFLVLPFIIQVPGDGCGLWSSLPKMRKRISFVRFPAVITDDVVFVSFTQFKPGNESFPNTTVIPSWIQFIFALVPIVKIANYRYRSAVWRPYTEIHAPFSIYLQGVGSKFFV